MYSTPILQAKWHNILQNIEYASTIHRKRLDMSKKYPPFKPNTDKGLQHIIKIHNDCPLYYIILTFFFPRQDCVFPWQKIALI